MMILYEDNHLLVAYKEKGILSQSDGSNTKDMVTLLKQYLKEKYQKKGNVYLGLVHRLDKETSGVMVFAKTSKAARRLTEQIKKKQFEKWYLAVCYGTLEDGEMEDYLEKKEYYSIVSTKEKGKYAHLSYQVLATKKDKSLVRIQLDTGRNHQIRVQFASRGHALIGDKKYGDGKGELALSAYHLSFYHPITKEKLTFEKEPEEEIFQNFQKKKS